jgi:hypothetical protein
MNRLYSKNAFWYLGYTISLFRFISRNEIKNIENCALLYGCEICFLTVRGEHRLKFGVGVLTAV